MILPHSLCRSFSHPLMSLSAIVPCFLMRMSFKVCVEGSQTLAFLAGPVCFPLLAFCCPVLPICSEYRPCHLCVHKGLAIAMRGGHFNNPVFLLPCLPLPTIHTKFLILNNLSTMPNTEQPFKLGSSI